MHVPQLPAVPHAAGQRCSAGAGSDRARGRRASKGINLPDARAIKQAVNVPVICTGGFQTASVIARRDRSAATATGSAIARPLVANNDLANMFAPRPRPRAAALHLLQQVPGQRRREPARLLRGEPLRLPRGDGARRSCPSTSRTRPRPVRRNERVATCRQRDLSAARVPQPDGQEPHLPLEHRRAGSTTTTAPARRRGSTGS